MKTVSAALVIIGNEILSGRTQDKNVAHIATRLNEVGIQLREVRVVPDVEAAIVDAVNAVRKRYDYVFTTGGIGPTHDDITTESVAKAFSVKVVRSPEAESALRSYIPADRINAARLKMADVPDGARLIPNDVSAAPGFAIGNVFVMAGVPLIMKSMLEATLPHLKGGDPIGSLSVTTDLTEGAVAAGLSEIQDRYPDVDIGSYPHYIEGERSTTLVCRAMDPQANQQAHDEVRALITELGGKEISPPNG